MMLLPPTVGLLPSRCVPLSWLLLGATCHSVTGHRLSASLTATHSLSSHCYAFGSFVCVREAAVWCRCCRGVGMRWAGEGAKQGMCMLHTLTHTLCAL